MKRSILSLFLILALLAALAAVPVSAAEEVAYPVTGGSIYFDPASGAITRCGSEVTEAVIPAQINGVPVTAIADNAFYSCLQLKTVEIPDSVTHLGYGAFAECESLTSVEIPGSVGAIAESAFYHCSALTSATVGEGVSFIGLGAFSSCGCLKEVTFPASLTYLDDYVFDADMALTDIYYGGTAQAWRRIDWGESNPNLSAVQVHFAGKEPGEAPPYPFVYNVKSTVHWTLPTVDGQTITDQTYRDKNQILIFLRPDDDWNLQTQFENLAGQLLRRKWGDMSDYQFIVVCISDQVDAGIEASREYAASFQSAHVGQCKDFLFTYTTTPEILSAYQKLLGKEIGADVVSNVVIDRNETVRYYWQGTYKPGYLRVVKYQLTSPADFNDVAKTSYCYDAVRWASERDITTGVATGIFGPEQSCTRGQIVTFLWRAQGQPDASLSDLPFTDVGKDTYCYKAVCWAVANRITTGISETAFEPNKPCTRGQAVTFLHRAAGKPEASGGNTFTDVQAGSFCYDAVLWAVQNGITNGAEETLFAPNRTCTRGHIVTFLYRASTVQE